MLQTLKYKMRELQKQQTINLAGVVTLHEKWSSENKTNEEE